MNEKKYSGTRTEKNLMEDFSEESQMRNKHTYSVFITKKQLFKQITDLFLKRSPIKRSAPSFGSKNFHETF